MTSDSNSPGSPSGSRDLLNLLVEKRVITSAQAEAVRLQSATLGVAESEFLIKNGMVTDNQLRFLAPWIYKQTSGQKQRQDTTEINESLLANTSGSSDDYQQNLARYRAILKDILGSDGK